MNNWNLFHRYRRLADEGKAKYLSCPDCESRLITTLDPDDDDMPRLWCPTCDSTLVPGLDLTQQVRAIVTEHYKD